MTTGVIPALRVTNYRRSLPFYTDGLGFRVDWEHTFEPGFPVFATINRDGLTLYLTEHTGDAQPGALVFLYVPDVDAWYDRAAAHGLPCDGPPAENIPGLRDFRVKDPDGNTLDICTRLRD